MVRPPAAPATLPSAEDSVGEALLRDIAATGRLLGAQSVRASIVDLSTMSMGSSWTFVDQQYPGERTPGSGPDSAFLTAPSTFEHLGDIGADETLVRRLSPRRWAFAWRLDSERAVVGEAQFRDRRDSLDAASSALLRLLCNSGIRSTAMVPVTGGGGGTAVTAVSNELVWPQVERRQGQRPTRADKVTLGCSIAALVCAGWLLGVTLPRAQQAFEAQRARVDLLNERADRTAAQGLALALSTRDYGDVQSELSAFASLGYFSTALVTNTKQRVIAMVGPAGGQQIGAPIAPELEKKLRKFPLATGGQDNGTLWVAADDDPAVHAATWSGASVAAGLAGLASLVAATVMALRLRRRR